MKPFLASNYTPCETRYSTAAAAVAGVDAMTTAAQIFSHEDAKALLKNFSVKELVIVNGGDIFAGIKKILVLNVFAGKSMLSEKSGTVILSGSGTADICTSSGTAGSSVS